MRPELEPSASPSNTGKKALLLIAAAMLVAFLPACNTVRGVGEDMAAVGNTLARTGR